MKTIIRFIFSPFLLLSLSTLLPAQDFEIRLAQDDFDYIAVQVRETSGTGTPSITTDIMDLQFEVRWAQSFSSGLDVGLICSGYKLVDGLAGRQGEGGFYWRVFAADSVPFNPKVNWVVNQWQTIGRLMAIEAGQEGTAAFALAPGNWVIQGLNINLDGIDYPVTVGDSLADYLYPTTVYDFIWKGGAAPSSGFDQYSWTCGLNWEDGCGTRYDLATLPSGTSKCLIPGGLTCYPKNINNFPSGQCDVLRMNNGAYLEIPSHKVLYVSGRADINPGAGVKVVSGGYLRTGQPD